MTQVFVHDSVNLRSPRSTHSFGKNPSRKTSRTYLVPAAITPDPSGWCELDLQVDGVLVDLNCVGFTYRRLTIVVGPADDWIRLVLGEVDSRWKNNLVIVIHVVCRTTDNGCLFVVDIRYDNCLRPVDIYGRFQFLIGKLVAKTFSQER